MLNIHAGLGPNATHALLSYAVSKGYPIFGVEPSNEAGCIRESDLGKLVSVLRDVYPDQTSRPRLIGADTVGNPVGALQCFLNRTSAAGEPALAGNYHAYPASTQAGLAQYAALKGSSLPQAELWVGETAKSSGGCGLAVSQTFPRG